ncbi:hypothetical protein D2V93_14965, partial [Flagellimonas taeanensis]|uniref:hypothetical protein n=1 Tax=Flagellimonas taeanensis TaxID=1005926 RepID=UPI000EC909EA
QPELVSGSHKCCGYWALSAVKGRAKDLTVSFIDDGMPKQVRHDEDTVRSAGARTDIGHVNLNLFQVLINVVGIGP